MHWTEASQNAALLIAKGKLQILQISVVVGVAEKTVHAWKKDPEFMAVVNDHRAMIREEIRRVGIADLENRVEAQNDRWNRLRQLMEARADSVEMAKVPGGKLGVLVRKEKEIGKGDKAKFVEEFELDKPLLDAILALEKQVAQELGQWNDAPAEPVQAFLSRLDTKTLTNEQLDRLTDFLESVAGDRSGGGTPAVPGREVRSLPK